MIERDWLTFWTKALDVPELRVVPERRDRAADPVCFSVVLTQQGGACPT